MATTIVEFSSSQSCKFDWKIENFSELNAQDGTFSDVFCVGSFKWKVQIYPKGRVGVYDHISIFLVPVDMTNSVDTVFSFQLISQTDPMKDTEKYDIPKRFPDEETMSGRWGYPKFVSLSDFHDPYYGYIVNDTCIIKVEVTCNMDEDSKYKVAKEDRDTGTRDKDSITGEYPGAGQHFGEGRHDNKIDFSEEMEDVGGFSISRTQAPLYKQIWLKYGHIPSTKVMPIGSYQILVMVVKDLMCSITDMQKCHYVDLSSEMIQRWEDMIIMAEKLEFNIGWLRQRFERVKIGMGEMQNFKMELLEHGQHLRATKSKIRTLRNVMIKAEVQLIAAKGHVREKISGLLSESDVETYLEIGEDLLLDGFLDRVY